MWTALARLAPSARTARRGLSTNVHQGGKTIADLVPSLHRLKLAEDRFVVKASAPISHVARHLLDERLTFAIVVDDVSASDQQQGHAVGITSQKVVGIVNERKLMEYAMRAGTLSFFTGREQGDSPTYTWMTPAHSMLSARLDDTLESALATLHLGIWRHLPVLDYYGRLHSILDLKDALLEVVGPRRGEAAWADCTALDILGAKRKVKIMESSYGDDLFGGGSSAVGWHEALSEYLLAHAARHTIGSHATVEDAARQMRKEALTFLVVREVQPSGESRVVGLVNERSFVAFCTDANVDGAAAPLASIMTPLKDIVHVNLTDSAANVIDAFYAHNVRHLPVIDSKAQLAGIISVRDLLRPLLRAR